MIKVLLFCAFALFASAGICDSIDTSDSDLTWVGQWTVDHIYPFGACTLPKKNSPVTIKTNGSSLLMTQDGTEWTLDWTATEANPQPGCSSETVCAFSGSLYSLCGIPAVDINFGAENEVYPCGVVLVQV